MWGTTKLYLLTLCYVYQSSAGPTVSPKSRDHSTQTTAGTKEAPVTNQPSVSMLVILENLNNSNPGPTKAPARNESKENPFAKFINRFYNRNKSAENRIVTLKSRILSFAEWKQAHHRNQSTASPTDTLKNTSEVALTDAPNENFSESPLVASDDGDADANLTDALSESLLVAGDDADADASSTDAIQVQNIPALATAVLADHRLQFLLQQLIELDTWLPEYEDVETVGEII